MRDYKTMYYHLLNQITEATHLSNNAQSETEDLFFQCSEDKLNDTFGNPEQETSISHLLKLRL